MAHMCLQTTESSHLNNRGHGTTCWEYLLLCRVFCLVTQSCLTFWDPMDCSLPDSSVHRDSLGKNTGVGCHALLQRLFPTHGLNPGLPDCEWILYCLESSGKPENTGAGSLSLLQGILPTQESNQGLPHCRWFFISWATREALFITTSVLFSTLWTFHMLSRNHLLWKKSQKEKHIFLSYRKVTKVFSAFL